MYHAVICIQVPSMYHGMRSPESQMEIIKLSIVKEKRNTSSSQIMHSSEPQHQQGNKCVLGFLVTNN